MDLLLSYLAGSNLIDIILGGVTIIRLSMNRGLLFSSGLNALSVQPCLNHKANTKAQCSENFSLFFNFFKL